MTDEEVAQTPEYRRLLAMWKQAVNDRDYLGNQVKDLGQYVTRLHTSISILERQERLYKEGSER